MQTEFVVKSSAANMPSSCKGRYMRVAVLEVEIGTVPTMISERARGVVRIVKTWEKCSVGKTEKSAYACALKAAEEMAAELNDALKVLCRVHTDCLENSELAIACKNSLTDSEG